MRENVKKKIKIPDIIAPPSYFKATPLFQPKITVPMADIVRRGRPAANKNYSFFFFSFGHFLIPRLLPKLLAIFLAVLLVATPVWQALAEELTQESTLERQGQNKEKKEIEIAAQEQQEINQEDANYNPPAETELEMAEKKETNQSPENVKNPETAEIKIEEKNPEKIEKIEEITAEENYEENGKSPQEEIVTIQKTQEENSSLSEEGQENSEDIYEQIRRDLDSEWKVVVEKYQKQLAAKEDELNNQKKRWEESLTEAVKQELKKELSQKCVKLAENGYYCLSDQSIIGDQISDLNNLNGNFPPPKEVFSLKHHQKNSREIFLKENEALRQITDNDFDDIFPAVDVNGNLIVWQSLINGFWQIFIYDSNKGMRQLTNSERNNMNPGIQNGRIVWQSWLDNNWEILFAERKTDDCFAENDCWTIRRLTQNNHHDMFPKIAGNLITWQTFKDNLWQVVVYDIKTQNLNRLTKGGEKTENPRFVILWESREFGQKKYFTYDLSSGELTEIKPANENDSEQEKLPSLPLTENIIATPATSSPIRSNETASSPEENE